MSKIRQSLISISGMPLIKARMCRAAELTCIKCAYPKLHGTLAYGTSRCGVGMGSPKACFFFFATHFWITPNDAVSFRVAYSCQ